MLSDNVLQVDTEAKATGIAKDTAAFDARLSVLETNYLNIREDLHGVASELRGLADKIDARESSRAKKDWVPFWMAATVITMLVTTVGGAIFTVVSWRISVNESGLKEATDSIVAIRDKQAVNNGRIDKDEELAEARNRLAQSELDKVNAASVDRHSDAITKMAWQRDAEAIRSREIVSYINVLWQDSHDGKSIPLINLPNIGPGLDK